MFAVSNQTGVSDMKTFLAIEQMEAKVAPADVMVTWIDMRHGRSDRCGYRYFGTADDGIKDSLECEYYGRTFHFNSAQEQFRNRTWSR